MAMSRCCLSYLRRDTEAKDNDYGSNGLASELYCGARASGGIMDVLVNNARMMPP